MFRKRRFVISVICAVIFLLFITSIFIALPLITQRKCGQLPGNLTLKFTNNWQTQYTQTGTLQILNAYLDDREFDRVNRPLFQKYYTVRILAMLDKMHPENFYCQLWYDDDEPVIVKSNFFWIWKENWANEKTFYQPYLISCETLDDRMPGYVSVVENKCDSATNLLEVLYEKVVPQQDFVVCVKGLNFPFEDKSAKLVEWIELVNLLGANRIHFYKFNVHPNVQKVLNYYTYRNRIEVTDLKLVGDYSNEPLLQSKFLREQTFRRRLQEVIPFNDCLYKYLHSFKYIVSLDIDEIIVPRKDFWRDLILNLYGRNGVADSYLARNVYFFDYLESNSSDVPDFMHILRHVTRAKEYSPPSDYVKGFHDTRKVVALYNHIPLWCFRGECNNVNIDLDLAQLQHYRADCVQEMTNCEELKKEVVLDTTVWRFKEVIKTVEKVLSDLKLLQ